MARIMLTVENDELNALVEIARIEKRDTRAQGAMLLREALENRGLLTSPIQKRTGTVRNRNKSGARSVGVPG